MIFPTKKFTKDRFEDYIQNYDFGTTIPGRLIVHNYRNVSPKSFKGNVSIQQILGKYQQSGWPAFPHIFISEDEIYNTYSLAKVGCHAGKHNATWQKGTETLGGYFFEEAVLKDYALGIVLIGNYDTEEPSDALLETLNHVVEVLQKRLHLRDEAVIMYRDLAPTNAPGIRIKG